MEASGQFGLRTIMRNVTRPALNIIFLLDVSGSMRGDGRINSLNNLMRELPAQLKNEADNKKLRIILRVIAFGDRADYVVGTKQAGVELNDGFIWNDLECQKRTATASAIKLAAEVLEGQYLGGRNNRAPIVFLLTDGECTESDSELKRAVEQMSAKLGGRAVRVAIGIGDNYNTEELKKFASIGLKPNALGNAINDHFIYNVGQRDDILSIIEDIKSVMAVGSNSSIIY